jgi:hypothetical protein
VFKEIKLNFVSQTLGPGVNNPLKGPNSIEEKEEKFTSIHDPRPNRTGGRL